MVPSAVTAEQKIYLQTSGSGQGRHSLKLTWISMTSSLSRARLSSSLSLCKSHQNDRYRSVRHAVTLIIIPGL
jgi:hypothetical protein